MTLKQIPWAMTNGGAAANPAERLRQANQSNLGGTGVENAAALAVTSLGTPNMSVNVAPGGVWIPGTLGGTTAQSKNAGAQTTYGAPATFTSQGSYYDYNDAAVNLAIAAANATNPRIDLVVVTVQDSDYAGGSNQALLQVITGTPAASPVAPAVPASSLVLAQIAVAANATSITSGNITDTRPIAGAAATWTPCTPSLVSLPAGISVSSARYKQIGETVHCRIITTSGNWDGNSYYVALPVVPLDDGFAAAGSQGSSFRAAVAAGGTIVSGTHAVSFQSSSAGAANPGPVVVSVTYEAS